MTECQQVPKPNGLGKMKVVGVGRVSTLSDGKAKSGRTRRILCADGVDGGGGKKGGRAGEEA